MHNTNNLSSNQVVEIRKTLHEKWDKIKSTVHSTGSDKKLKGPTYAFVIYLDLIEMFPARRNIYSMPRPSLQRSLAPYVAQAWAAGRSRARF